MQPAGLSPRGVAGASTGEKTQLYIQRYVAQFPAAGEIILFDRSWYNRAGVERVMGFCSDEEYERFIRLVPAFEREVVEYGIILLKYFLNVSQDEQRRRFDDRIEDPIKHWKLSPMDTSRCAAGGTIRPPTRDDEATHTSEAPWYIVPADDKRRARLNLIRHLLDSIPYAKIKVDLPKIPRPAAAEGGRAMGSVPASSSPPTTDAGTAAMRAKLARWLPADAGSAAGL